jgi:hypothetical protein
VVAVLGKLIATLRLHEEAAQTLLEDLVRDIVGIDRLTGPSERLVVDVRGEDLHALLAAVRIAIWNQW